MEVRQNLTGGTPAKTASQTGPTRAPKPSPLVQPQHAFGQVNDPLEHDADSAAEAVLAGRPTSVKGALLAKQQKTITPETKAPQQSGHDGHMAQPRPVAAAVSQAGVPLAADLRSYFEPRFGHDFSHVRICDNAAAGKAARSINARAFTFGPHM